MNVELDRQVLTREIYSITLSPEESKEFLIEIDEEDLFFFSRTIDKTLSFVPIEQSKYNKLFDFITKRYPIESDEIDEVKVFKTRIDGNPVILLEIKIEDEEIEKFNINWPAAPQEE